MCLCAEISENMSQVKFAFKLSQGFSPPQQWKDEHPDMPFEQVALSLYLSNTSASFINMARSER